MSFRRTDFRTNDGSGSDHPPVAGTVSAGYAVVTTGVEEDFPGFAVTAKSVVTHHIRKIIILLACSSRSVLSLWDLFCCDCSFDSQVFLLSDTCKFVRYNKTGEDSSHRFLVALVQRHQLEYIVVDKRGMRSEGGAVPRGRFSSYFGPCVHPPLVRGRSPKNLK